MVSSQASRISDSRLIIFHQLTEVIVSKCFCKLVCCCKAITDKESYVVSLGSLSLFIILNIKTNIL